MDNLTKFQMRVLKVIATGINRACHRWEIAINVFPDFEFRYAARGGCITQIEFAGRKLMNLGLVIRWIPGTGDVWFAATEKGIALTKGEGQ